MHGTSAGNPVPLSTFGGVTSLAGPDSLPEGASPRTYDTDFQVGSVQTRDGLTSQYAYTGASVGPNGPMFAASATWFLPNNILARDGKYASLFVGPGLTASTVSATPTSPTKIVFTPPGQLNVSRFGFDLPATTSLTGYKVTLYGYADTQITLHVTLTVNGNPKGNTKTVMMPFDNSPIVLGSFFDTWGANLQSSDVNSSGFGLQIMMSTTFSLGTGFLDYCTIELGLASGGANFNHISTFTAQNGNVKNLSLDANGNLWVEDVTNSAGNLTLAATGIAPGSYASAVNGPDVQYLALNDLTSGSDVPKQYTKNWIDRISQVGPGASPIFTASSALSVSYPITNITQPPQKNWGFSYFLQSVGPGSISPGNVVTVYYSDSTQSAADSDLVSAFNSGKSTYIYTSFTGGPVTQGPYTVQVTSVGLGKPPGQPRQFYYYTYVLPASAAIYYQGSGHSGYTATYQRTLAKMTMSVGVPQLSVGSNAVVTGNSVTSWNATWVITQTLNSGSMSITQTALDASGTGTYSYSVQSGANPVAGQNITITGTLNANGALNVVNVPIAGVSGTNIGTFTITSLPGGVAWPSQAEAGQGVTSGTIFDFEPGLPVLGSSTSPIYGNGTGGSIVIAGSGQLVSAGTRQGTVFFITRNGYYTAPAPPVIFTTPANTTAINAVHIPIGPPNVIARGIAFTEAGQLGVPGANFYTIPTPVKYTVNNVTYTSSSLIINDNVTTTANFFFTDNILLSAQAIDVQGYNLFNLIEIGNPGWIAQYDSRNFYGLCQNKVQNFNNLSFDGGYLPGDRKTPLGWTVPDSAGQLLLSPVFGNSYYIQNNVAGSNPPVLGDITQSAYQDAYLQPILQPNTDYSVRITCRAPSGRSVGNLVVEVQSSGVVYGSFVLYFGAMKSSFATYGGSLNIGTGLQTIPSDMTLHVYAANPTFGADVEIDRLEIYPTAIPVLTTTVFGSYAGQPEAVDAVTGAVKFTSENQQPVYGAVVMYDTLYALKETSMYSLRSSPNLEPAQWDEPEVAQKAGACGVNAYDFGEQWIVEACRNGLYLYEGGQPGKIMQEIYQIWESINWTARKSIWVRNDVKRRRLLVGVPMATPNFWLPNAPSNANPTTPNIILMCNYQGVDTGEGLKVESAIHVTMFGTLEAGDMRRKWSLWQIPSPYASFVKTGTDEALYICNGRGNSKMYALDPTATTDDGAPIDALYTTYGFVNLAKAAQYPLLGMFRKRWGYMTMTAEGAGVLNVRLLPNTILGPNDAIFQPNPSGGNPVLGLPGNTITPGTPIVGYYPYTVPGGFNLTEPAFQDREATLNFAATRTFVEFRGPDFEVSNLTLHGKKDVWNALTGQK